MRAMRWNLPPEVASDGRTPTPPAYMPDICVVAVRFRSPGVGLARSKRRAIESGQHRFDGRARRRPSCPDGSSRELSLGPPHHAACGRPYRWTIVPLGRVCRRSSRDRERSIGRLRRGRGATPQVVQRPVRRGYRVGPVQHRPGRVVGQRSRRPPQGPPQRLVSSPGCPLARPPRRTVSQCTRVDAEYSRPGAGQLSLMRRGSDRRPAPCGAVGRRPGWRGCASSGWRSRIAGGGRGQLT